MDAWGRDYLIRELSLSPTAIPGGTNITFDDDFYDNGPGCDTCGYGGGIDYSVTVSAHVVVDPQPRLKRDRIKYYSKAWDGQFSGLISEIISWESEHRHRA